MQEKALYNLISMLITFMSGFMIAEFSHDTEQIFLLLWGIGLAVLGVFFNCYTNLRKK